MKYLKKFNESLHNQPTENENWKFLSPSDCSKELEHKKIIPISEKLLLLIKDRFNIKDNRIKLLQNEQPEPGMVIYSYRYDYHIYEYEDEWFTVWLCPNPGTMVHQPTYHWDYLCDQLDGLLNFLDYANSENKINFRPEYGDWINLPIKPYFPYR